MHGRGRVGMVVLGVCLTGPAGVASAGAATTIGASQIEVSGPGAGVTITRAPFRMSFTNAAGQTVLSQVAATGAAPTVIPPLPSPLTQVTSAAGTVGTPVPPVAQPVAGVQTGPASPTTYAPLSFLVGVDQPVAEPAGQFAGDLLSDTESGVEYSARDVVAAVPDGSGVRLVLSTNDPSGRQLIVTVAPEVGGAIRVSAVPSDPTGVAAMADSFTSSAGEAFHGFGGRHNALDQHGQDFYNWLDQENVGAGSLQPGVSASQGSAGDAYLFPNGPQAAYYVQSSFVSNHGYGFLLDRSEISRWRLDSDRPDAWQTEVAAPAIDYVVAPGNMSRSISTLTTITGRQRAPSTWGLGPMLDREVQYPSGTPTSYEQQVNDDLQNMVRYRLPLDAYRIEGWQYVGAPFLHSVVTRLRARGIRPLVYFRAFVGQDNIGTDDPAEFNTAVQDGYVATTASGAPYLFADNFQSPGALIDFTNPAAVRWWQGRIDAALDAGVDGFMLDFGEQTQPAMHFFDGETGSQMHNRYPVLYQQATRAAVDAYARRHPRRSFFFFTRSGYTGDPGSAAYENANFPGDETTDWSASSGLASQTPDMLNRAIGGAYGFATDIGGYFDIGPFQPTTKELLLRWAEWAALSPVFRLHGSASAGTHVPWRYDQQTVDIYNALSELHISARALILALWKQAARTGMPVTRPLYLAYPNDLRAAAEDQEWLLGPDVLVAPIVEQGASSRAVYFPRGCWRSPANGRRIIGPRSVTIVATLAQLPFFFRCRTHPFTPAGAFGAALDQRPSGARRPHRRVIATQPPFTG